MLLEQDQRALFLRKRALTGLRKMRQIVSERPEYQPYLLIPYDYAVPGDSSIALAAMPIIGVVEEIRPFVTFISFNGLLHGYFEASPKGFNYHDPEEFYPETSANGNTAYTLQFLDRAADYLENYFKFK